MRIIKKNPKKRKMEGDNFIPVSSKIDENIKILKDIFKDCSDIVKREFRVGVEQNHRMYVVYIDGMADRDLVHTHILRPLMLESRLIAPDPGNIKRKVFELISEGSMPVSDMKEKDNLDEGVLSVLSGDTLILIDGIPQILIISSRLWPTRSIEEPTAEMTIRGPRQGFVETFRFNTALLRREIRDPKLKIKSKQLGRRTKTDLGIVYLEDVVNAKVLEEVEKRLDMIDIDGILESGYIEQLIEDSWISIFPQVKYTERPDIVAASLLEGRVAILVDNTPMALIVPTTLNSLLQSPDDYYERWWVSTLIRWIRIIALIISFLLPATYIAVASYHSGIIPTKLALFMAGTRETVPFPVYIEAFAMEITFELLREAGIRLPGQIGATIGIVGSLIIGQATVQAGLVSPIMVIIVALTAIASFAIPGYNLTISFRMLRFLAMFAAAVLGLYGLILVLILTLAHLATLNSFGVPYLSPFVSSKKLDWKDSLVKSPLLVMKQRPEEAGMDKKRMKDLRLDEKGHTKQVDTQNKNQTIKEKKEQNSKFKTPKKIGQNHEKGGNKDG